MTEEIAGFQTSPKAQVQAAFEEIARRSMHDLSFLHPSMPVYVSDFTLFEGQWTGCVITPWMLSAVIFPGPDQLWPLRKVSEKIGLQLGLQPGGGDSSARCAVSDLSWRAVACRYRRFADRQKY